VSKASPRGLPDYSTCASERSRTALAEVVRLAQQRRETFFTRDKAGFAELDDILLVLEGVAVWAQFRMARAAAPAEERWQDTVLQLITRMSGWVEPDGLLLFGSSIASFPTGRRDFSRRISLRLSRCSAKSPRLKASMCREPRLRGSRLGRNWRAPVQSRRPLRKAGAIW